MYNETLMYNGLGTQTIPITEAGRYQIEGKSTIPTISNGGGVSALTIDVYTDLGGMDEETLYEGDPGQEGFLVIADLEVGDAVSIVFASAATPDQGLNKLKHTISIWNGA